MFFSNLQKLGRPTIDTINAKQKTFAEGGSVEGGNSSPGIGAGAVDGAGGGSTNPNACHDQGEGSGTAHMETGPLASRFPSDIPLGLSAPAGTWFRAQCDPLAYGPVAAFVALALRNRTRERLHCSVAAALSPAPRVRALCLRLMRRASADFIL
ncbi:hypothetical protein CYMTET_25006 [Cymbomonas tetramitiformis]|uniref:Uncharacterized protein n=1 Tax=Cymbomonas tetramitiformis TaxID=36881 RepID=A0AAE0FV28_9CHLO|nr:hypothetical protein CYMTET_25006 [Cymbomonas tetramitiformis]